MILRGKIDSYILRNIDIAYWKRCAITERAERESLAEVMGTWKSLLSSPRMKGIYCAPQGRLGQDVELRRSESGKDWRRLSVAVDSPDGGRRAPCG